jgi:hypothetical protein
MSSPCTLLLPTAIVVVALTACGARSVAESLRESQSTEEQSSVDDGDSAGSITADPPPALGGTAAGAGTRPAETTGTGAGTRPAGTTENGQDTSSSPNDATSGGVALGPSLPGMPADDEPLIADDGPDRSGVPSSVGKPPATMAEVAPPPDSEPRSEFDDVPGCALTAQEFDMASAIEASECLMVYECAALVMIVSCSAEESGSNASHCTCEQNGELQNNIAEKLVPGEGLPACHKAALRCGENIEGDAEAMLSVGSEACQITSGVERGTDQCSLELACEAGDVQVTCDGKDEDSGESACNCRIGDEVDSLGLVPFTGLAACYSIVAACVQQL